jgi:hypothetical protein
MNRDDEAELDARAEAEQDRAFEFACANWGKCACGACAYIRYEGAPSFYARRPEGSLCEAPKLAALRGSVECGAPICAKCAREQQVEIVSTGSHTWETYCRECLDEHRAALEDV